eukprot:gnl/TRDRNA2_/TRDRNA2_82329_c0_seq1.p1 gnl/TRDRNA2_/TRDRNA2_82329_c0~~gnl/TRDRNA2_/TRDRNA2_82329_c0_seq1.p1  ORF type:complete len:326 (-),score=73.28 gnl/TRDRNA2_/TRDRNA2_82329_c0_seq1:43-1020(-)
MGLGELKVVPVCCCGFCCAALIFTVIALPLSFKSLEQGSYALQLGWHSQKISDEVVTSPGMHMVGLGNMLIEFPSTFEMMIFWGGRPGWKPEREGIERGPIHARTSDGLPVTVSVSFQWKLEPMALIPLYKILGDEDYKAQFVRLARKTIVEACSHFPADMYFTNRTQITATMWELLSLTWNQPEKGLQASIQGLQLREVDLPAEFDGEIIATQELMQEVEVAQAEREKERIAFETATMVAQQEVQELLQGAIAKAEKIRLENEAVVNQIIVFQTEQAQANAKILQSFQHAHEPYKELFNMMKVRALSAHQDDKMLISLKNPSAL